MTGFPFPNGSGRAYTIDLNNGSVLNSVKVANATNAITRLTVFNSAVGNRWVPRRQTVEVTNARPHVVRGSFNHAGDVDLDQALLLGANRWGARRQRDLRAAHTANETLNISALNTNFAQQLIYERRLGAESQR